MFVDRERELEILEQRLASDRAEMFVLYGRRRVGKTELLARLCRDRRHVFYVADLSAEATLRAGLSKAINATVYGEAQAEAVYPTWQALFRALAEHARKEALLVVLDEFSYLAAAHPPLPSVLQRVWDDELRHTRLKLVLCGSAIGMMEDVVLGYEAPLYGRRTGQLLLEALHIQDAMPFLRAFAPEDSVRAYGAFGGTPAYLRLLEGESDLESKATRVRELGEREIHFALFARSGFSEALRDEAESRDDLILFGLDDVLGTSAE